MFALRFYGCLMHTATSLWCRKDGFKWFIFLFMMILGLNHMGEFI